MRRTIFLALLATLLLVPSARAATPTQIIRDCADDGVLQGNYTPAELRKARSQVPADVNEYSDCSDVLSRAIAGAGVKSNSGGGGGGSGGGGSSGSGSSGSGASAHTSTTDKAPAVNQDWIVGASTPKDHAAVSEAGIKGARPLDLSGRAVAPDAKLSADFGRNRIPTTLIVALALLGVAALTTAVPLVRRRVVAHGPS